MKTEDAGLCLHEFLFHAIMATKKIVRIQKRIVEENTNRTERHARPIISTMADDIVEAMMSVKQIMDHQVYDRNDFLKKVAYFA